MSTTSHGIPPASYPDPAMAYSYAVDTAGGMGYGGGYGYTGYSWDGAGLGGLGGLGSLGGGMTAGYPKGGTDLRKPALMGVGGMQFIPDGGVTLSHAIDDVIQRLGPGIYSMMAQDECISACLEFLVYSVLGGEVHVEPAIVAEPGERMDGTADPQRLKDIEDAKKYADECKRSLNRVPEFLDELEAVITEGMIRGSGLGDLAWEVVKEEGDEKPLTLLKSFQCRASESWAVVVDQYGQFTKVAGYTYLGPQVFERDRFFVYTNRRRKGDPRGTSELRAVYDPWNFKIQGRPERSKYISTFSNPTVVLEYDGNVPDAYPKLADGSDDTSAGPLSPQSQAERVAANVHGASWMAIPIPWKATLIEPSNDGGAFTAHEEDCNKAITMGLLLNPRTLNEAEHGSKADSQASVTTSIVKTDRKQTAVRREIERSIFKTQTRLNHGDEAASRLCPLAKLADADTADLAAMITAWVGAGYKSVPRQYAALDARFGVPIRSADEIDELQKQQDAAQQATIDATKAKAMGAMGGPKGQGDGKPGGPPQDPGKPGETTKGDAAKPEATPAKPAKPPAKPKAKPEPGGK